MSISLALVARAAAYFFQTSAFSFIEWTVVVAEVGIALLLLAGYLTSIASILAGFISLGCILSFLPGPGLNVSCDNVACAMNMAIAGALACLGPGAFSVDAFLFGRREIIIPSSKSKHV